MNPDRGVLGWSAPITCGLRIGCALILLSLLGAGCSSPEARVAYHLERGRAFLEADNVPAAEIEFRAALSFDAFDPDANLALADLAENEGRKRDARFHLRDILARAPDNHEVAVRLAMLLRDEEPWQARQLLLNAISSNPNDTSALLGLSQIKLWLARHDQALEIAETAIAIDPDLPGAYWQLGIVYEAMIEQEKNSGQPIDEAMRKAAVEAFERFVASGGKPEWKARMEQAQLLAIGSHNLLNAVAAARRALDSAREADGDQPKLIAAGHLANLARRQRDRKAYAEALETLLDVTPRDFRAWRNLAEMRASSGGSAEAVYRDLLSRFPDDPDAHILYSKHVGNSEGVWAALRYFDEQIDAGIDPPRMLSALRSYQIAYRLATHAERTLARMQQEFPDSPWTQMEVAKQSASQGYSIAAIAALEKVVQQEEISEAFELLAKLERFHERPARALRSIEKAVETRGYYDPRLHQALAQSRYETQDFAGYLEAIETIAKHDKLTPEQRLGRARALYRTHEADRGRQALLELVEDPETSTEATLELVRREAADPAQQALSRKLLLAALAREPENPDLLIARVELRLRMNRADLALRTLDGLAIETFPAKVRYLRSRLRADTGNFAGALDDIDLALRADPLLPDVSDFALILYVRDTEPDARQQKLEGWIRTMRSAPPVDWMTNARRIEQLHLVRSRLFHVAGRTDEAIAVLEAAIANYEYSIESRIDLAYLLAVSRRDPKRAIEIASDVVSKQEANPRALDTLGLAYLSAEKPFDALRNIRLAIGSNPGPNALFHYHESLSLQELGREAEALEAVETVLALDPDFPRATELKQILESAIANAS